MIMMAIMESFLVLIMDHNHGIITLHSDCSLSLINYAGDYGHLFLSTCNLQHTPVVSSIVFFNQVFNIVI